MKITKLFTSLIVGACLAVSAFAQEKDIVDTAVGAGKFKTLVALVQKAGLVDVLKGKGPFTVFAPTDAAFAKLPKALVDKVVNDKALLTKILTYHVLAANVMSTDLKDKLKAKTVQGEEIVVRIKGKTVRFNKSNLVTADIKTSNGVIHVIDTVLLPPSVVKALAKSHH
ncbi:MAG: fasciclin domain-containing protein [Armatimonadetes bacterium]|nr:fasciclin domain-containing protein [Armatimonadota bacterium]